MFFLHSIGGAGFQQAVSPAGPFRVLPEFSCDPSAWKLCGKRRERRQRTAEYIHSKRKQENYLLTDMMNSISYLEPNQISIANALRLLSDRIHYGRKERNHRCGGAQASG